MTKLATVKPVGGAVSQFIRSFSCQTVKFKFKLK